MTGTYTFLQQTCWILQKHRPVNSPGVGRLSVLIDFQGLLSLSSFSSRYCLSISSKQPLILKRFHPLLKRIQLTY